MRKSIQNVLVLFVVIVSIFTFINMVSVDRAEAVSCPEGLVCTPVNTAFVCPVGYTCTPAPTCPIGYTCKPIEIQSITCPSGYICKLTNNGGGSSGGNSGGGHSNGCYRFDTNLSVGSFWSQRSTGADVVALQTILMEKGFDVPSVSSKRVAKGVFDADTKAAVIKFQTSINIPATGFVGPLTRDVLNSLCSTSSSVPVIGNINPVQGGANTNIIISGTNLSGTSVVEFYDSKGQFVGSLTPSSVSATNVAFTINGIFAANVSPGTYKVGVVTNACPGGCNSNRVNLTINSQFSTPAPTPYSAPSAKVISPNGGETWTIGQTYFISTASNGELGTRTIKLNRYSDDSVRIGSEVIGTTNTDSFYFKVPVGTAETRYEANRYKIQVQSNRYNEGMGVADESDGYISIVSSAANPPPSVTVTSPNSGEFWSMGEKKTITWSYANWNSGIFGNKYVDMYLVPMDGRGPMKLATNFNSPDGTVHVTIYEKTSDGRNAWLPGRYKIRVVCNTNNVAPFNSCMDESDGYITVVSNPPSPTPIPNSTSMSDQTSLNASIWDAIKQYFDSKATE